MFLSDTASVALAIEGAGVVEDVAHCLCWRYKHSSDPAPKHPNHVKAWAGGQWAFERAWIDAGRVSRLANVEVT